MQSQTKYIEIYTNTQLVFSEILKINVVLTTIKIKLKIQSIF